jgi:hypothetical protein
MGLFKRKSSDPISARAHELNAQIHALEKSIKALSQGLEEQRSQPCVRSTALPESRPIKNSPPVAQDHIFEAIQPGKSPSEFESNEHHYNEFGVRKYDLSSAVRRFKKYISGEPATNPKLVSYLAAGSIKGLRPLRYEKRIARNRFIFLSIFFVIILWGTLAVVFNQR